MKELISENPRKRPQIASPKPEWGDAKDVLRLFGVRQTLLYEWWYQGLIKSASIRKRGNARGKRLFNLQSIRQLLASRSESAK